MSYLLANSRHCLDWVALLISLLGTKWSSTMAMCSLSNTPSKPAFSNSLMATGVVMSLPSTRSSFALMSWPALTSARPACAAKIFCVRVIPMVVLSFYVISAVCPLSLLRRQLPQSGSHWRVGQVCALFFYSRALFSLAAATGLCCGVWMAPVQQNVAWSVVSKPVCQRLPLWGSWRKAPERARPFTYD